MSNLKRWKQVGQGEFRKWETPGQTLEGTWRGKHDGQYGPLGTLETSEGNVTFPLHTVLLDRLDLVKEGADVRIVYDGKRTGKKGQEFKAFTCYVADDDDIEVPDRTDPEVPF